MNGILEKYVYSDEDLSLKEQADLVDKYLDMMYDMLYATFPNLKLTTSGSALHNNFEISVGDGIKLDLLPKKTIEEGLTQCSGCGREYTDDIKEWKLRGMINDAKELRKRQIKEKVE